MPPPVDAVILGAAIAVITGTVVCVASRDARPALLGLTLVMLVAPLLTDPPPPLAALAFREAGALLGAYVLWFAVREARGLTSGPLLGGFTEAAFLGVIFVGAFGLAPVIGQARGPLPAFAAGTAVALAAFDVLIFSRDAFRFGMGVILALLAATLIRAALAGSPGGLEHVITGFTLLAAAGGAAHLCLESVRERGDLALSRAGPEAE